MKRVLGQDKCLWNPTVYRYFSLIFFRFSFSFHILFSAFNSPEKGKEPRKRKEKLDFENIFWDSKNMLMKFKLMKKTIPK